MICAAFLSSKVEKKQQIEHNKNHIVYDLENQKKKNKNKAEAKK